MKNNLGTLQTFSIWSDNATKQNRVDVEYYQPYFDYLIEKVSRTKFELKKLDDITEFIGNGRTPAKDKYVENGEQENAKPIIKAGTASGKFVNLDKLGYTQKNFSTGAKVQKGDIFILSAAHQAQYVGKSVSILENEPSTDTSFVGELICVRADTSQCLPEYLFSILSSETGYLLLNREKRGQTSHIYPTDIKEILLPVPSLNEQKKIITAFNNAYTEKRKKEARAKEILKSIDDFVLGELGIKLEPEKEQMTFEVWSEEVENNRLDSESYKPFFKKFFKSLKNGQYPTQEIESISQNIFQGVGKNETENDEFTLLKVKNIKQNNEIDFSDVEFVQNVPKSKILQKGDVISPFIGEAVRQIKFSIFEKGNGVKYTVDNNTGVIRIDKQKANSIFVAEILNSSIGKIQITKLIGGGGVPFLGAGNAKKFLIPLPELKTQKKIADKISEKRVQARMLFTEADELVANAQKQVEQMILNN